MERSLLARQACFCRSREDLRIHRRLNEHGRLGAGGGGERGQRVARDVETGHGAGHGHNVVGTHGPAVAIPHPVGDEAHELAKLRAIGGVEAARIAEHAAVHVVAQRVCDGLRRLEVHVRDEQRNDVVGILAPLIALRPPAVDYCVEVHRIHASIPLSP